MSEENKAVVRRYFEALNRGNLDEAATCVTNDYVLRGPGFEVHGPNGWKDVARLYLAAFPDLKLTIQDQIAEGDKVATRYLAEGTHRGELAGVPASGRRVSVPCLIIGRIVNNRVAEDFEVFDQLGMFQMIGTLPAMPAAV